jgi:hypothetical protein
MDGHELRRTLAVHEMIARAYSDDRFPSPRFSMGCDVRMLTVTILWVVGIERKPKGERWTRVCEVLGLSNFKFWETIRADLPRYEPPGWKMQGGECEAPMIRREGLCGQHTVQAFRVTDPVDGKWRVAGFCRRHDSYGNEVHVAERARIKAGIPVPQPNMGGLLPCYVGWNWPENYARADPTWKPPGIGICADDWPVLAKVAEMAPPTLSLLAGERDGEAVPRLSGVPSLRVVR